MRISFKGIITGIILDLVGTVACQFGFGILLGLAASIYYTHQGLQDARLEFQVAALIKSPGVLITALSIGWFFTGLGAFFASIMAGQSEWLNSGIVGIAAIFLAWGARNWIWHETPIVWFLWGVFLSVPAALIGGSIAFYLRKTLENGESG